MGKDDPPPYTEHTTGHQQQQQYAPPPAGFVQPPLQPMGPPHPQPQQQSQTHVVINTVPLTQFGPSCQHTVCPSCHAQITTTVRTEPNTKTHLFALLLCLLQCYCCCCIPYCVDSCQSQNHYCPNCNAYLGTYQN